MKNFAIALLLMSASAYRLRHADDIDPDDQDINDSVRNDQDVAIYQ
jgi:hypothetical protein